jgi:putative nucleotidyltransferase-like protein
MKPRLPNSTLNRPARHYVRRFPLFSLAHLLCCSASEKEVGFRFSANEWQALIRTAESREVAGSVHLAIQRLGLQSQVLPEFQEYCALYFKMCKARNQRLRLVAQEVSEHAARVGSICVLLKGAAMLALGNEEMLGVWTMRDVDVLVPHEAQESVAEALRGCGYQTGSPDPSTSHYATPLIHPEKKIWVELHTDVGMQRNVLSSEDLLASPVVANGQLVPRPIHMILHNCYNSQIQDRAFEFGIIPFKSLVQLDWLLRNQKIHRMDWDEFWFRMRKCGCANIARSHLELSHWLLGSPLPDLDAPTLSVHLHLQRCVMQLRYPLITHLCKFWGAATPNLNPVCFEYQTGRRQSRLIYLLSHFWKKALQHRSHLPLVFRRVWRDNRASR